jgi:N-acetylglucosaminyldiphosphoundecaprenol N-acetyl-beta-D-mannosaminyltransferase
MLVVVMMVGEFLEGLGDTELVSVQNRAWLVVRLFANDPIDASTASNAGNCEVFRESGGLELPLSSGSGGSAGYEASRLLCQHCRVDGGGTLERVELFGLRFVSAESERVLARTILDGEGVDPLSRYPTLITPNVDIVLHLHAQGASRRLERAEGAAFVLPDGAPVVWSSRLFGKRLKARLAGSTLFAEMWPELSTARRVLMIASSQELVDRLGGDTDNLRYVVAPRIEVGDLVAVDALAKTCVDHSIDLRPEFIVIGLSHPKQEEIAHSLMAQWDRVDAPVPLMLMLGASAEMYVGMQRRAPVWMQRAGLEWFHRFLFAPKRLFRRYFIEDTQFLKFLWDQWRATKKTRL